MSRYAVVVTCSHNNYVYGLNALLNGLDYYQNTADLHILVFKSELELWEDYKQKIEAANLGFKVFFPVLDDILSDVKIPEPYEIMWPLTFGRWHYTEHLRGQYDAILHTGTDVMVWNNIMEWFEVAAQTDFIIMGHNALGTYNWPAEPYVQSNDVPYADTPCFVCPEKHWEALNYVSYIGGHYPDVADMPSVFYALKKFNKKVILLPDNHWVRNYVQSCYIMKDEMKDGGPLHGKTVWLDSSSKHLIKMVHGKYWSMARINNTLTALQAEGADEKVLDIWKVNLTHSYEACKFFNTQWKIKLDWSEGIV